MLLLSHCSENGSVLQSSESTPCCHQEITSVLCPTLPWLFYRWDKLTSGNLLARAPGSFRNEDWCLNAYPVRLITVLQHRVFNPLGSQVEVEMLSQKIMFSADAVSNFHRGLKSRNTAHELSIPPSKNSIEIVIPSIPMWNCCSTLTCVRWKHSSASA